MNVGAIRIAFILPNFQAGGAERVLITIANQLDRTKFQPVLIVLDDAGPLRSLVAPDIEVLALYTRYSWRAFIPLVKAVRGARARIVISTMAHMNMMVLLAKPWLGGAAVVVREAVTPSYFADNFLKRTILQAAYYSIYPLADRILSPTAQVFKEMPAFLRGFKHKLQRIFNPVDAQHIRASSLIDAGLRANVAAPEQRLFVAAGRLVDQKGFDRLITALAPWRGRDDWRLVILGAGPALEKLQTLRTKHGLHQITLAGFDPQPWRYFAIADAFLLPSRHEGLPNVALESLAWGVPVIATRSAGGISEIAAQAASGDVLLADDMDSFIAHMEQVRPRATLEILSRLPDCFSLGAVVAAYEEMFSELAGAQGAVARVKKIVFVIADLGAGGAQRVMALLANALAADEDYEITVLSTAITSDSFYPYDARIHVQALGIESAGGRLWAGVAVNIRRMWALRRFFRAQQPDVVISFLAETNTLVLLSKTGLSMPVIISERSDPYFYPASRLWRSLRALTYRGADLLVCQTRYAAGFFGQAVKTAVIPNPVFMVEAVPVTPPVSGPYVLGVGRLSSEKGFDILIKAHRLALDHVPDLKLVLVGDGPERDSLMSLAQQCGSADQVVFAGAQKDMAPYFTHAQVFVLPSHFEGMPNALLEAMAHGVPAIVTPGFRAAAEIITSGHNGILLDRLAPERIADYMIELCQNPLRQQAMGAAARSSLHNLAPEQVFTQWRAVIGTQTGSS